jgi:uncharacterized membrane protein YvlD (DUF360 family)
MDQIKAFFRNFLTIFFANYLLPGIELPPSTKLPHLSGDLLFALCLGLLNTFLLPAMRLFNQKISAIRVGLFVVVLNVGTYGLMKLLSLGIKVSSLEGFLAASFVVSVGAFLTCYLEIKKGATEAEAPFTRVD